MKICNENVKPWVVSSSEGFDEVFSLSVGGSTNYIYDPFVGQKT